MFKLQAIAIVTFLLTITIFTNASSKCNRRKAPNENYICVCNSTYCDFPEPTPELKSSQYAMYTTSKSGKRMELTIENFTSANSNNANIIIDRTKKYQKIMAFGGALTDSSGINIASLPKPAQELLMKSYFSDKGNRYNLLRIPMGGTDFSVRPYTYDDVVNDTTLSHFQLQEEDFKYKIPYIKQAQQLSSNMILMGCPWSAPPWMKTNRAYAAAGGRLRKEYYQIWADYYVKFLKAYQQHCLNFTIISPQNEPAAANSPDYFINGMAWTAEEQGEFVAKNLGPTLRKHGFDDLQILIGDDQRSFMQYWIPTIAKNKEAMKYVAGAGIHWYFDELAPPDILTQIHNTPGFENRWMLYSESCEGSFHYEEGVFLGNWDRAETYFQDIIDDLNNWVVGWTDWNLVLNMTGGPTYTPNIVDAPIIVDAEKKEFYKQPMFYAVGHASRFLPRNSVRLNHQNTDNVVTATVFETPNNQTVILILNLHDENTSLKIFDKERKNMMQFTMEARSLKTIIY